MRRRVVEEDELVGGDVEGEVEVEVDVQEAFDEVGVVDFVGQGPSQHQAPSQAPRLPSSPPSLLFQSLPIGEPYVGVDGLGGRPVEPAPVSHLPQLLGGREEEEGDEVGEVDADVRPGAPQQPLPAPTPLPQAPAAAPVPCSPASAL